MKRVPSHEVTAEMLAEWGFPVERTEKIVGSSTVIHPGMKLHKARHAAWQAGFISIETPWPPKGGHCNTLQTPESRSEAFAWAQANLREKDQARRSA